MISSWIFAAMIPAAALLMLHLAVGPFGHTKFSHLHTLWRKTPRLLQFIGVSLSIIILVFGLLHLFGLFTLENY